MKSNGALTFLIFFIIGAVFLSFMTNKLIGDGRLPSLQKYMTDKGIPSLLDLNATSSLDATYLLSASSSPGTASSSDTISLSGASSSLAFLTKISIKTPSSTVSTFLADNDTTREKGLGGVTSLSDQEGMIFVFQTPGYPGFWMKDTLIPLDMVWINDKKEVVGISDHILPSSFPNIFLPPAPVSYVLEINAGLAKKIGIEIGTSLDFSLK